MEKYWEKAGELLKGAVDIHIHTAPDIIPRKVSDITAAEQAKQAGMKAIVIKNHVAETASRAFVAAKVTKFSVHGGLALNLGVGGLNYHAVEAAAKLGAKFIWMPTLDSAQYLKYSKGETLSSISGDHYSPKGLSLLNNKGALVPEVNPILEIAAQKDLILCTGHISKVEAEVLIDQAKALGVKKIVVTHANANFLDYSIKDLRRIAAKTVWIELSWVFATKLFPQPCPLARLACMINAIGAEKILWSTDGGQMINPAPLNMMQDFMANMLKLGITESQIRLMSSINPSKILSI